MNFAFHINILLRPCICWSLFSHRYSRLLSGRNASLLRISILFRSLFLSNAPFKFRILFTDLEHCLWSRGHLIIIIIIIDKNERHQAIIIPHLQHHFSLPPPLSHFMNECSRHLRLHEKFFKRRRKRGSGLMYGIYFIKINSSLYNIYTGLKGS